MNRRHFSLAALLAPLAAKAPQPQENYGEAVDTWGVRVVSDFSRDTDAWAFVGTWKGCPVYVSTHGF